MRNYLRYKDRRAVAFIFTFIILASLAVVVLALLSMIHYEMKTTQAGLYNMQAFYIAEAGLAKARWALTTGGQAVGWGENDVSFGSGTYSVTSVDNGDGTYTITAEGYVPSDINPRAKRKVIEEDITPGGSSTNYSLSAAATASSQQGGNTAPKAIDGASNTKWKSTVNNGSWLKLDFTNPISFNKIVYDGKQISSYVIQYSNDDVTFTPVSGKVEAPVGTVSFNQVTARYLRFSINGNKPEVNELETYNTSGSIPALGQGKFITLW